MTAFSQKYSPEQRRAIVDAVLDGVDGQPGSGPLGQGTPELGRQMTAKEAQRAAAEGRLPDLEPFDMNLSTIRNYAQEERRDRDGKKPSRLDRKPPAEAADEVFRRVLRMADATLRRAEAKAKSSKGLTLKEISDLAKISSDIDRAAKQRMTKPASPGARGDEQAGGDQAPAEPQDLAAQLAAEARDLGAPSDQAPKPTRDEGTAERPALSAQHDTRETEEQGEDRVPVRGELSLAQVGELDAGRLAAAQAVLSGG